MHAHACGDPSSKLRVCVDVVPSGCDPSILVKHSRGSRGLLRQWLPASGAGVLFNKDVVAPGRMRRKIHNPRILLLDCPLEYKKGENQTNVEITKEEDWWVGGHGAGGSHGGKERGRALSQLPGKFQRCGAANKQQQQQCQQGSHSATSRSACHRAWS
jgi:hypothetical protein